jgi:hypothetical protein
MDTKDTLQCFLGESGFHESPEYVSIDSPGLRAQDQHFLEWGRDKIEAEGVVFQRILVNESSYPLAYLRRLEDDSPANIAKAHRLAWNMGRAPLLFLVTPGKILVYSTYDQPRPRKDSSLDDKAGLIDTIDLVTNVETARQTLRKYRREELLSGSFWESEDARKRFDPRRRVERSLLNNLSAIRSLLVAEKKLNPQIVHSLLGRAIFIQYLQDRKDSDGYSVFPPDYFERFLPGAESFPDVLSHKRATYSLFETLQDKFNGDIFPVTGVERDTVQNEHLALLAQFLRGKMDVRSKQLSFWPYYSFNAIPIEFISNMYEEFFHYEKDEQKEDKQKPTNEKQKAKNKGGTYYTPQRLVEFVLDEVLPWEGTNTRVRILDPACGSGIFLVEAYRRLVSRWRQASPKARLDFNTLKGLATDNLHGVDENSQAIRVASFSLCLAMCDYLEPRYVWANVKFPPLRDMNLWDRDFFDFVESRPAGLDTFDLVIGNPPWESDLSKHAEGYLKQRRLPIGDKQIAQAFLWASPELCRDDGKVALVAPSKGLLFNASRPNKEFRRQFLERFKVNTIVNFAALRRNLFAKAVGPAAPIIYEPIQPPEDHATVYCCPKPMNSPEDGWHYIIEHHDICRIPWKEAIKHGQIWKTAMWGGPRDWELVSRLEKLSSLRRIADERRWTDAEGFKVGTADKPAPWLTGRPYVAADALRAFTIDESSLPPLDETHFHRAVESKKEVFDGPHVLVGQSPKAGEGFVAALLRGEAVFPQSVLGIAAPKADEGLLGAICAAFATNVCTYFAMMTSSRWLVERDELAKQEVMQFPMPVSLERASLQVSLSRLREATKDKRVRKQLIESIFKAYDLSPADEALIDDAVTYTLAYFRFRANSQAAEPADHSILRKYGLVFSRILRDSFGQDRECGFHPRFYGGNSPLVVLEVSLCERDVQPEPEFRQSDDELSQALESMDKVLLEQRSPGVYVRRDVHVYLNDRVLIAKRNQKRLWTQSAAMRDADEVYADIMRAWGGGAWR